MFEITENEISEFTKHLEIHDDLIGAVMRDHDNGIVNILELLQDNHEMLDIWGIQLQQSSIPSGVRNYMIGVTIKQLASTLQAIVDSIEKSRGGPLNVELAAELIDNIMQSYDKKEQ